MDRCFGNLRIRDAFAVVGLVFSVYFLTVLAHEMGHVYIFQQQGIEVRQLVLLGYTEDSLLEGIPFTVAWTAPSSAYDESPHICWHKIWRLDFSCLGQG